MSEAYFPNHTDTVGGQQVAGLPPIPQVRPYDYGQPPSQQLPNGYPGAGHPSVPPGSPQPPSNAGNPGKPRPKGSVLAVIAILVALTVALGAYAVITRGHLGDAEAKADGLADSLAKANDSVGSAQAELESIRQELQASQQAAANGTDQLEVATTCATLLSQAWTALLNDDVDGAMAALDASSEPCEGALGDTGGGV
jgi:hypothetical protein